MVQEVGNDANKLASHKSCCAFKISYSGQGGIKAKLDQIKQKPKQKV